jgi:phosphoribosyl-AMP cyclohydrolase|tara:strand:- start:607 stop:1245 length:639 start_codon:yes stop_codon:yes gene_type:complete
MIFELHGAIQSGWRELLILAGMIEVRTNNSDNQVSFQPPFPFWNKSVADTHSSSDALRLFAPRTSIEQVEEGNELAPKFDEKGFIPCVTTDHVSGELLMVAVMNQEALEKTIVTGEAHYFSRSRQCLWHKGATSGLVQKVVEMRIDDDQDCIWLRVDVAGGASCHVGYRSCFYRKVPVGVQRDSGSELEYIEAEKTFDPKEVYGDAPNPTQL